jgi:hypothetical protein
MAQIDPSTNVGKIRLRIGDWRDPVFLSDDVINAALTDAGGNLPRAAQQCAQYILAVLSFSSHQKLAQLEVWGSEQFKNYQTFLRETINNPAFMSISPLPYVGGAETEHPLIAFTETWNEQFADINGSGVVLSF